jgi:anti-anti-sigma factor
MNTLQINREVQGKEVVLKCSGRLDANWAGHLNDFIDQLVREGQYFISLNMTGIEYISSAGIRSLVTQYKNLMSVNGYMYISAMSENVKQVLGMVGMTEMLTRPTQPAADEEGKPPQEQLTTKGFTFALTGHSPEEKTTAAFYGMPEQMTHSAFEARHARKIESGTGKYAFGLGAIGNSFGECKSRFGEYLMLGKNIAYLPADGSKKPDYMVSSGKLVASLIELYGIHFEGTFSHKIRFEHDKPNTTLGISKIAESLRELTRVNRMGLVMIAESGGLIGTSLNASPVEGTDLFSFPGIKNTINFTTEPAYYKMLTLSAGYLSFGEEDKKNRFLRPLTPDSSLSGHIHTAVFPYVALKKTDIDLDETIDFLFNNSELTDILHLIHDTRDITGLGESQFLQGFCWIAPIESTHIISTQ